MQISTFPEVEKRVKFYFKQYNYLPFFIIADDAKYCKKLKDIAGDVEFVRVSDFCFGDRFLDVDLLVEHLNTPGKDAMCFGLGEFIFFSGQTYFLRALQDKTFARRIVFVFRGISSLIERLAEEDDGFRINNCCRLKGTVDLSVVKFEASMNISVDAENFSELIRLAEDGASCLTVKTAMPLSQTKKLDSFYDAAKRKMPFLDVPREALNEEQWREFFFDAKCDGYPPDHWRTFVSGFDNKIADPYLKFVFKRSATFDEYSKNLVFALLAAPEDDFARFYQSRKEFVKNSPPQLIAEYVERVKENFSGVEAIKYLTDNTDCERRAIIPFLGGLETFPADFEKIYEAAHDYLVDFNFGIESITNYFRQYKKLKISNVYDENFKSIVRTLGAQRLYNRFETRHFILESLPQDAALYWIDALGVEFLSFIKALADKENLSAKFFVARAVLPTLTSVNKNFFDEWQGEKFDKNSKLDDVKHSPETFDASGKCSAPVYFCDELKVIADAIIEIKFWLNRHKSKKVILTSDHGASRLAVMFGRENKIKLNAAGEHGGRCCLINHLDQKPPDVAEENGFWISTNYTRFAKSRMASVEVHGGATLEEVLVPVIELGVPP